MRRFLCLGCLLFFVASSGSAREYRWTHYGVRPLGMGNAYVGVADDFNAIFYNPAGLARLDRWDWEIINPTFTTNLTTFNLKVGTNWRTEAETALRGMYGSRQDAIGKVGRETFEAIDTIVRSPVLSTPPANGAIYPNFSIGNSLRQAAAIIKGGIGTRTIFVSLGGAFDTHSGQLAAHMTELPRIGDSLAAFAQDLGGLMDDVVVLMVSEFGRTAFVNGSAGTDHGSAKAVFVMGGGVRGGRMLGRWPGLANSQLYQTRDLASTTDFRDVYAEVARKHLGLTDMATLFPGYSPGAGVGLLA